MVLRTGDLLNRLLSAAGHTIGSFKYSDIGRERGTYRAGPAGYRPYLARHEPPRATATNRRARIVYDRLMAARDGRVAEISRTLAQSLREPVPDLGFWDDVGNWMIATIEGSREPGSDRFRPAIQDYAGTGRPPAQIGGESTTVLRPLWESIVLDLSFLLGEHMIARLKTACWGFDGDRHEGSVAGDPRIVTAADRDHAFAMQMPFRSMRAAALYGLQRRQGLFGTNLEPFRLGDGLRQLSDPRERETPGDAREAFVASLEAHLAAHGDLPPHEEIVQWLVAARLSNVPPLPSRLAAILDERDRRQGRTGPTSWRAT